MIYNKIQFDFGEGLVGLEGYQVCDDDYQFINVTDLEGNVINLPQFHGYFFTEVNAPTPPWG